MKNKLTKHIKDNIGKWNVIYSEERKFIWLKNPKTAGTSMYHGIMRKEIDDIKSYKLNLKEFDLWWNNLTDEKIDDYFTFTFVRNPYDRLVSAFNHVVMENLFRLYSYDSKTAQLPIDFLYMLFNLFVQRGLDNWDRDDHSMFSASSHWMPQNFFYEIDGYQFVDFVGKYENLKSDWKYIAKKLEVSEKLPFVGASTTGKGNKKTRMEIQKSHYYEFYKSSPIVDKVIKFYNRDFELLDYESELKNV